MTITTDYFSYTEKWKKEYGEKTLVLIQVGSFFEVYALLDNNGKMTGSNIEDFASINDMVISKKSQCVGNLPVMMAGFGVGQIDKYVRKLEEHGYTIVIYTQDTQEKNTTRSLAEIISPGTFFSQDSVELSNNIICVWIHHSKQNKIMKSQVTIGLTNIDIYTGKTSVIQFVKDYYHNPSTYDELEKQIAVYKPSECIIISNLSDNIIDDIIEFASIDCDKIHRVSTDADLKEKTLLSKFAINAEKQVYQREIVNRFYPNMAEETIFQHLPTHFVAIQSFTFLLDFVYQHSPNLVRKITEPTFENQTDKLVLANHSLKQLNMLDDTRHKGRLRSVGTLLNNCVTSMGKRRFNYNLNNPTTNISNLKSSYDITEYLLESDVWQQYREDMSGLKDMEKFMRKLVFKKTTPKNLALLAQDLEIISVMYERMKGDSTLSKYVEQEITSKNKYISEYCKTIVDDLKYNFSLEKCSQIDDMSPDKLSNMNNDLLSFINKGIEGTEIIDNLFRSTIDSREKLEAIQKQLCLIISSVEKSSNSNSLVKIHETAKSDPILMGTKRRIVLLQNQLKKQNKTIMITYESSYSFTTESFEFKLDDLEFGFNGSNKKDMIVFNKQIKEISGNIQLSKDKLINEISLYYSKYIDRFLTNYQQDIEEVIEYITIIDIAQCKAYIANKYNYCKPIICDNEKSYMKFAGIRHPLIEHLQTKELYVTNDLEIGNSFDGLLLYGTNAVGKTSFIKSVGIAVVMAQAGLFVPCVSFEYCPYQCIFTRILGNDNIFKGLSTFAVEMSELRTILNLANEHSLVLGDELCSGTESDSALSIFTAGLEMLHKKKSTFLFATHFHEINNYDEIKSLDRMRMMHMEVTYDRGNDMLVYDRKLKDGPGDSMYGLEVCKSLNLPFDFLQRAHDIRMKYNKRDLNILAEEGSHFNKKKLKGNCEICKNKRATEVHHLIHQKKASEKNDYIDTFHKNHLANLINICDDCHNEIHNSGKQHRVVKTTKGYSIRSI